MTVLALAIGAKVLAAGRVRSSGTHAIRYKPLPAAEAWWSCRDLLLDVAGDDEITAVGIACAGRLGGPAGTAAWAGIPGRCGGFGMVAAVRKMFPAAVVRMGTEGLCAALAARQPGTGGDVEPVLAGAEVLAIIAEERSILSWPPEQDDGRRALPRGLCDRHR
ncbi:hypothetical protein GV794_02360 [Nocardia cyriacigeorgica]|uniref:Uncharacterized protein n=1 Tax=Nocardia cyriacigeorgica TaxID=135487 RepID=A0A6P1CZ92_9NOCA|nr:hypothetical protein [Nocardia cyriacigeorgica]NEW39270.1 hypothetical protein [Nocardia cyriacigeorgica]NEW43198.1 hypothetical protein [Nocardia cyriacigeorgica]NEW49775.1 hypothetical protein [Nocardia cyriacigeorgica]NEW54510.1 hypothetical protein [Nocardia cyriacigeorgica]